MAGRNKQHTLTHTFTQAMWTKDHSLVTTCLLNSLTLNLVLIHKARHPTAQPKPDIPPPTLRLSGGQGGAKQVTRCYQHKNSLRINTHAYNTIVTLLVHTKETRNTRDIVTNRTIRLG